MCCSACKKRKEAHKDALSKNIPYGLTGSGGRVSAWDQTDLLRYVLSVSDLSAKGLQQVEFDDITLFYGGNGSGKSTLLNVIAAEIGAERMAAFNKSNFWDDYVRRCETEYYSTQTENRCIITSDDVFDYMLDIRSLNDGIHEKREERLAEYTRI